MIAQVKKVGTAMWICVALIGAVVATIAVGLGGSWVILPLVGCVAMMGMMMWMMMGGKGHGGGTK